MSRIPKRRGGFREINAPDKFLRLVQARLHSRLLSRVELPEYTWAFEPGKSVPEMAKVHVGKQVIVSLDIRDFFPSITQRMIETMIIKEGLADGPAARTISELCTYKWYLPQGGITSPKISNLIVKNTFGDSVKKYCDKIGLEMTVYADDITMSEKPGYYIERIPSYGLSVVKDEFKTTADYRCVTPINQAIEDIGALLRSYNFSLHHDKTKVMLNGTRKTVCGVVVNEKTNLAKKERLRLRAMVHNVCKNGVEAEAAKFGDGVSPSTFISYLKGKLNWYRQLNSEKAASLIAKLNEYLESVSPVEEPTEGSEVTEEAQQVRV